jgi:hypothetical protein
MGGPALQPCEEKVKKCLDLTQKIIFAVFLTNIPKKNIVQNMTPIPGHFACPRS